VPEMIDILATFIVFFAVIDPMGTVPVFIAVTHPYSPKTRRKIALISSIAAALILLFFISVGEIILSALSIPLSAFQIAGGIILFLFALTMIFGESKPDSELRDINSSHEIAIFPLAIPSIASPGAMLAAVLMTENSRISINEQVQTALVMLSVIVIVYILMLLASSINRLIGNSGASVISRVMGLILAAVATNNVLSGLKAYFTL